MRSSGMLLMVLCTACGQSQAPVAPQAGDDAGDTANCESLTRKATGLYQVAAVDEGLAPNLHTEFVEANVHMVMVDCHAQPKLVISCVASAETVADIESKCLIPLDDSGEVEALQFASHPG